MTISAEVLQIFCRQPNGDGVVATERALMLDVFQCRDREYSGSETPLPWDEVAARSLVNQRCGAGP